MAEIEAIVEPEGIADDVGWESVAFNRYLSDDSSDMSELLVRTRRGVPDS